MMQKNHLIQFWRENFGFRNKELGAFSDIKREDFVINNQREVAYEDTPLPLLRGKTISQPTTVMIMTSALELEPGDKVFEIGSGSGYQTAIIAKLVGPKGKVISTEVVPELVLFARENLIKAGITNTTVMEDDGSLGKKEHGPYDKIIITAACKEFPKPLIEQLKVGGIIVAPVGNKYEQEMIRGVKDRYGNLEMEFLGPFIFSPMYGKYGFEI